MITVPHSDDDVFVHVPPGLDLAHIAHAISRRLRREIAISDCATTNLCAKNWGGVSNSGATVLRLSLNLDGGDTLDLVAKILSPDSVNLSKIDCRFSSRLVEVAWAEWWGRQDVPWVPVIYDTRADIHAREFWIIHEYFPQVGWPGFDPTESKGMGQFSADADWLRKLIRQVALLQAYSKTRIEEIRGILPSSDGVSIDACSSQTLLSWLTQAVDDSPFLLEIGVTNEERVLLETFTDALDQVPDWVERWDVVCAMADWGPDNFGTRDGNDTELVTFDWGSTRLAPMEEDIDLIFMRIKDPDLALRDGLLAHYLDTYADKTGHRIEPMEFRWRMPWSRFFVTLRYMLDHMQALRWVPHQTRSRDLIHLFIGLCKRQMEECPTT